MLRVLLSRIYFILQLHDLHDHLFCRRLRVSIERDMGGTSAAPKTIRFFVPYWIMNDSSLPLAYRVMEIEPSDSTEMDSNSLSRAVKTARTALKNPTLTMDRKHSGPRRNIRVLEVIEDNSPMPSMLSPQDSAGRSGVMLFTSQKDAYPSPRVGIAVAIRNSEIYSPGISLLELEKKVIVSAIEMAIFFPHFFFRFSFIFSCSQSLPCQGGRRLMLLNFFLKLVIQLPLIFFFPGKS